MINKVKKAKTNQNDSIAFDVVSERIKALMLELNACLEKVITKQTKKSKIKTSLSLSEKFKTEIKKIQDTYKEHLEGAPLTLETYLESINSRANELNEVLFKIKTYPIKSITNQLKKEAKEQGIENSKIITTLNTITSSIINLVIYYTIEFEEYVIEQLCEMEIKRININYYIQNSSLQFINHVKYKKYTDLLYKGIKAYYNDFKAFLNNDSSYSLVIEKFFTLVINKIETLANYANHITVEEENEKEEVKSIGFPSHIFADYKAYQLFEELAGQVTKQDEIGFYFRQMSEKETPRLIMVRETVFRTWYNDESKHQLELKNPIKTYDRINGTLEKYKQYVNTKTNVYQTTKTIDLVA